MPDEFRTEQEMSRSEAAAYLRKFADELDKGGRVVLLAGGESRTIDPPDALQFRVQTSSDSSWLGGDRGRGLSFELGWNVEEAAEGVAEEDDLVIISERDAGTERVSERVREIQEERLDDPESTKGEESPTKRGD